MNGYDDGFFDDEVNEGLEDCALMPDGQCLKAGSEECDFECPMRKSEHFAGSEAWHRKHSKKSRPDKRQSSFFQPSE